jgi:hypothetical protein
MKRFFMAGPCEKLIGSNREGVGKSVTYRLGVDAQTGSSVFLANGDHKGQARKAAADIRSP